MDSGVLLFNHATKHCARLVVALLSLRRHYTGPATILDTGHSDGIIEKIAADKRLAVEVERIPFKALRRHSCYVAKSGLWRHSPYEVTLFLDADTLVVKPIDGLLGIVADQKNPGWVVTRFSDWVTTGEIVSSRIKQWVNVECEGINVRRLIRLSLESPLPAVNTGIVGWRADCEALERWERLTQAGWKCSFCDELAAQILLRQERHTLVASKFNSSPLYCRGDDAVIHHAHGSKHLARPDGRGSQADAIWAPLFCEAFAGNVGGIREWAPAGDDTLAHNLGRFR
jgi:hypothetical protein